MLFSGIFALFVPPNTNCNSFVRPFFPPAFISLLLDPFSSTTFLRNVDVPLNPNPILNLRLQTMTNHKSVRHIHSFASQLVTKIDLQT